MGIENSFNNTPPQIGESEKQTPKENGTNEIARSRGIDDKNIVPVDIQSLTTRLKAYFSDPSDPSLQEGKEIFLDNIKESGEVRSLIEAYPDNFDLLFYILSDRKLNPEDIKVLAHNFKERQSEISMNEKDRYDRIIARPMATEEEYRLGAYAESIESQVRDAVFQLLEKGYLPIESGFLDLIEGSQYIGIELHEGVSAQSMIDGFVNTPDEVTKKLFKLMLKSVSVDALDKQNRIRIVLRPNNKELPLKDWKKVWRYFTQCVPSINDREPKAKSDNGLLGKEFREAQDKIREGKNAWLKYGLAFVDGKVVSMSYQDFINL